MNLNDIPRDRPPLRGLQKENAQLKKKIDYLEAENAWLKRVLSRVASTGNGATTCPRKHR